MYKHKVTSLIMETFDKHNIDYCFGSQHELEIISVRFHINKGTTRLIRIYIKDNDVALRIWDLFFDVPECKRTKILELCNAINKDIRFLKFSMDNDNYVVVAYDFPQRCSDDSMGEMIFEAINQTMNVLNDKYELFTDVLYGTDEQTNSKDHKERIISGYELLIIAKRRKYYKRRRNLCYLR